MMYGAWGPLSLPTKALPRVAKPVIITDENRSRAVRLDEQKTEAFGLGLIARELDYGYNRASFVRRRMPDDTKFERLLDILSKDQQGTLQW